MYRLSAFEMKSQVRIAIQEGYRTKSVSENTDNVRSGPPPSPRQPPNRGRPPEKHQPKDSAFCTGC